MLGTVLSDSHLWSHLLENVHGGICYYPQFICEWIEMNIMWFFQIHKDNKRRRYMHLYVSLLVYSLVASSIIAYFGSNFHWRPPNMALQSYSLLNKKWFCISLFYSPIKSRWNHMIVSRIIFHWCLFFKFLNYSIF